MIYEAECPQCGVVAKIHPSKLQHAGVWSAGCHRCHGCKIALRTTYHPNTNCMSLEPLFKKRDNT